MFTIRLENLLVILLTVFFPLDFLISQETETDRDTFAKVLKSESRGLSDESIQEIVDIRTRLGGGTRLELNQLLPGSTSIQVASEGKFCQTNGKVKLNPWTAGNRPEELFFELLNSNLRDQSSRVVNVKAANKISSIRDLARRLDSMAADLEELGLFENADLLRGQAASIRMKARSTVRSAENRVDGAFYR